MLLFCDEKCRPDTVRLPTTPTRPSTFITAGPWPRKWATPQISWTPCLPPRLGPINAGETVLDVGSGAGFDCFIACQAVGPQGRVIGVDMTEAMLEKSRGSAAAMGLSQLEFRQGFAEELPVPDGTVDLVISNGGINLCPDKYAVFQDIFRALKPAGCTYLTSWCTSRFLMEPKPTSTSGLLESAALSWKESIWTR